MGTFLTKTTHRVIRCVYMVGIDLFSGAGGMSVGAERAGVRVALAVEQDARAASTYRFNHPATLLIEDDICRIRELPPINGVDDQPIIVFGGPPCQGFSTSNQQTRNAENRHNWLFEQYVRLVALIRPDWIIFENVTGILETEGGMFVDEVMNSFKRLDYTVTSFVLNAKDFGVPQNRSRFFVVASKHGIAVAKPVMKEKAVTVKEAIDDLPLLDPGANECKLPYRTKASSSFAKQARGRLRSCHNHLVSANNRTVLARYPHIPQGGNWEDIPPKLMGNYANAERCHTGIYRRLKENEASVVIGNYRKNMLIHPTQHRGLSVREAARLQSFPDSFIFMGSIGFQQQQVGNAVPPLLAQAVFETICNNEL